MKRLTWQMTLVFALVVSFTLVSDAFAVTRHVNGQDGNDNWDGLAATYQGGTNGPKETINAAIEVSSSTGDEIVVHYADGFVYYEADPATIPVSGPTPDIHKNKEITFRSEGPTANDIPTVKNWSIWAPTTFTGPFNISEGLTLADGTLTGGDQLTMGDGSLVTRTLGEITSGQLQFAPGALVDYLYNTGDHVTTGLEMPPTTLTTVINDLTTQDNPTTTNVTHLHLNEDKTMNGRMDLTNTGATFDLENHTLTLVSDQNITHDNDSEIINGLMVFELNGNTVVLNRNFRDLPNITTNTSGHLQVNTGAKVGVLTVNGTTTVSLERAGGGGNPIGGIVINSTGLLPAGTGSTVELKRNGNIVFDELGSVIVNSGVLFFSHANGSVGTVTFGDLVVDGGTVKFADSDSDGDNVIVKGNGDFFKGTWHQAVGAGFTIRQLRLAGERYRFGMNGQNADFSSVDDGPAPVHLLIQPLGSVTQQTVNGNKPGSIWYGTLEVNNNKANPAVIFTSGHLRVLDDVTFTRGFVLVDNCILSIGNEIAPLGRGDFHNASGFTSFVNGSDTGGRIAMNGNAMQRISGAGDFGSFEANNPTTVRIVTNDITSVEYFFLRQGVVDNTTSRQIDFNNPTTPPTIVKTNGAFTGTPNFVTLIDLEYKGLEKDYGSQAADPIYELPSVANGDPAGDKLRNLTIATENNSVCANEHGWVNINDDFAVNGMLKINAKQSLVIRDSRTMTLKTGGTFDIEGYLFTVQNATIALGAPGGFNITSSEYLPNIKVLAGSENNTITARGLRVQSITHPIRDFFCPDFDGSLAALATGTPGDITFEANGTGQTSSLAVNFTDTDYDHIADLTTDTGATLTLLSDLSQWEVAPPPTAGGPVPTTLTHQNGAAIEIGDFTYATKSANIQLDGGATITSSESGLLLFNGWDQYVNLYAFAGLHPTIDANVEINMQASTLNLLNDGSTNASDSLTITKDFDLKKGELILEPYATPSTTVNAPITLYSNLTLTGKNFYLHQNGSVVGGGTLFLNATNAPMFWWLYQNPSVNNLTIQNDVTIKSDNYQVTVNGAYTHEAGDVDLGTNHLKIDGTYQRMAGNYLATTGYLKLYMTNATPPYNFVHGDPELLIPNFWIQVGDDITTVGSGYITVQKRLFFKNLDRKLFAHDRKLEILENATIWYHSGDFDHAPNLGDNLRMIAIHSFDGKLLPPNVWPENSGKVATFIVQTWQTYQNDASSPNDVAIHLPVHHTVSDSLVLRDGRVVVTNNKTLTFGDGLNIVRVDGVIDPGSNVSSSGMGYHVEYQNNNNQDMINPTIAQTPSVPTYIVTGLELPSQVESLTFTRYKDGVNRFTVLNKQVTVTGGNTLIIRNNLSVQPNATLTVLSDVYFENESDVFPSATDPICEFWSPLVFAGDRNQMVYVPKDGMDIRPPAPINPFQPIMPGPARIEIRKDKPTNSVTISGGNFTVDHITFVNGLLVTEDENYVEIPAPSPGFGQGFDRSGVVEGNTSHVVGRVMKRLKNHEVDAWSSNERQEFPVGSWTYYRPMSYTFSPQTGMVMIPHNLGIIVQHIDKYPQGQLGFPVEDCDTPLQTFSDFYWFVQSDGTYSQEAHDLEVKASGLEGYTSVDPLRILRRHGKPGEVNNAWSVQGDCGAYDNADYDDGPTLITENTKGGLREEGAIFAVGLPEGQLPVETNFETVWSDRENPYNAMTFYITKAEFYDGKPLEAGDEIAIFDGQYCVGVTKLTASASRTAPAIVVASEDDPSDAEINGFTDGNAIIFKYWDGKTEHTYRVNDVQYYKTDQDVAVGEQFFQGQSSVRAELLGSEREIPGQYIDLTKGWNILSLAVEPFGDYNMFDTTVPNMAGDGVLNPIEPQLIKAVGTNDGTVEKLFFNWINTIGDWNVEEGYYVNVSQDVTLHIPGAILQTPVTLELEEKWNIISYPCLESEQNAINVLQPLIDAGVLKKVMDEHGRALEKLAFIGWYNGIGNMRPGEGYYLYVTDPANFDITCPDQLSKPLTVAEPAAPKHFVLEEGNPYKPMNFYINSAKVDGVALDVGDEVAVYDGDQMVGSAVVEREIRNDQPLSLIAGMDDGSGNGFTKGNTIRFRVWKQSSNQEVEINLQGVTYEDPETGMETGSQAFEPRATAMVKINSVVETAAVPQAFELQQNYPNPFNPSTTISYAVPQDARVRVDVYDITGKRVTTLVNSNLQAGYHTVEWNGQDAFGNQVATGVYFYKMTAGDFSETRKMLFTK